VVSLGTNSSGDAAERVWRVERGVPSSIGRDNPLLSPKLLEL